MCPLTFTDLAISRLKFLEFLDEPIYEEVHVTLVQAVSQIFLVGKSDLKSDFFSSVNKMKSQPNMPGVYCRHG